MERLTSYDKECNREMICRHGDCCIDEEYCPHLNEDNCLCLQEVIKNLAEYEDLEEQGLLLKLPCKVGDTVYVLCECGMIPQQLDGTLYSSDGSPGTATGYYCPYEDNCPHDCEGNEDIFDCDKFRQKSAVFEDTVKSIALEEETIYISTDNCNVYSPIGYSVFLTQAEAEHELERIKLNE